MDIGSKVLKDLVTDFEDIEKEDYDELLRRAQGLRMEPKALAEVDYFLETDQVIRIELKSIELEAQFDFPMSDISIKEEGDSLDADDTTVLAA